MLLWHNFEKNKKYKLQNLIMSKELVLSKFEELGLALEEAGEFGYLFKFEELNFLYLPDEDDENFLRLAVPNIFDVTAENRSLVMDVVNDTNMSVKYSKTCVSNDNVWAFYEHRLFGDGDLEDIIEHGIRLLQVTVGLFYRKIEGDDTLPGENENVEETKEDGQ